MDEPNSSGKRIVSKGRYLVNTGKKMTLSSYGVSVSILGIIAGLITCIRVVPMFWQVGDIGAGLVFLAILSGGSSALLYLGTKAMKEGKAIDAGIPFTRANTSELPAADSLVRASDPPPQARETVLLRPAAYGQETPAKELVRAASRPRDSSQLEIRPYAVQDKDDPAVVSGSKTS